MNRTLLNGFVFAIGLLVVAWIGAGYVGSHALALAVTAVIGVLYVLGGIELHRYRQATASLAAALESPPEPDGFGDWLGRLDPGLRTAVRQRVESGQAPLPAPALAPYLVGMLVLLGMLGTLLGMLVTLRGTGLALQSAGDLQAVRDSLAAPVEGLGVAFGTSIAGVAASAMLGLLAALCRRERAAAVRVLAAATATHLRPHSRAHQRDEALRLMQEQAALMPTLVERMGAMMAALEQQAQLAHERQSGQQAAFHEGAMQAWERLAETMAQSLERSAAGSARAAAEAVQPAIAAAMDTVTGEATRLNANVAEAVDRQLAALGAGFEANASAATALWQRALDEQATSQQALADALAGRHQQGLDAANAAFAAQAATLLAELEGAHGRLQSALAERDAQRLEAWREQLAGMAATLREDWTQAGEDAARRHEVVAEALARAAADIGAQSQAHAAATIAEISTLVEAASEAPRAAAEVVAELRQKLSDSMVRDTAMLAERTQLMETLSTLLDAVNHASTEQRGAIDALVSTTSTLLEQAGGRFGEQVEAGTGAIEAAVARLDAGATGVAGLGEALAGAVQQFGERNAELTGRLDGIAAALDASGTRSDEQLAYYVAQARELVDLSVLAQKQIIAELRQLPATGAGAAA